MRSALWWRGLRRCCTAFAQRAGRADTPRIVPPHRGVMPRTQRHRAGGVPRGSGRAPVQGNSGSRWTPGWIDRGGRRYDAPTIPRANPRALTHDAPPPAAHAPPAPRRGGSPSSALLCLPCPPSLR
eukprot:scaffold3955_cov26-Tisochrysis_lutea.AAC.5